MSLDHQKYVLEYPLVTTDKDTNKLLGKLHRIWNRTTWWQRALVILLSLLLLTALVVLILLIIVLVRAGAATTPVSTLEFLNKAITPGIDDDKDLERAQRLAGALSIPTVSFQLGQQNTTALLELQQFFKDNFPLVHNSTFIQLEVVNTYSLLYTVTGSDNRGKLPYLLAAHMDVVPANPIAWDVDPFGGVIINNTYIYGRGAIDNKNGVLAIFEAVEYMISKGQQPKRNFFMAFGHDEELFGTQGAQEIKKVLQNRGVKKLDFVLDEGLFITEGILPGAGDKPVAMIGVSEKGVLTVELSVNGTPGHSSFPPRESSIGILSEALSKLEKNKPPSMLGSGIERYTFEYLAPHVDFGTRMLYSNMWLFSKLLTSRMVDNQLLNSMIGSTTALTIVKGGIKGNVVPAEASATVNHRVHPNQRIQDLLDYDISVIDDPRVEVQIKAQRPPHPITPFGPDGLYYQLVAKTVKQTFPEVVVVPSFLVANTDTIWYIPLCDNIIRFFPTVQKPSDIARFHGNNERISVENFNKAVSFFYRLIQNADLVVEHALSS